MKQDRAQACHYCEQKSCLRRELKYLLKQERVRDVYLARIGFGQAIAVSPVQFIATVSALVGDGILRTPRFVNQVGNTVLASNVKQRIVSEETSATLSQLLYGVVSQGSGKKAAVAGYQIGGKTGTAQKFDPKLKQYSKKKYIASFCGMLPIKKPEIVILVIYDEPSGDYYASSVTAPVFAKIAQRAAEYLKIEPDIVETKIKKGAKK